VARQTTTPKEGGSEKRAKQAPQQVKHQSEKIFLMERIGSFKVSFLELF